MSKEQERLDRYEKLLKSKWAKRYKEWMTESLIFKDADEEIRESFVAAEVDRLVMLVAETDDIGYVAEECLKIWSVDDMINANGIIWMLEEIQQGCFRDGKRLSGRLEVD